MIMSWRVKENNRKLSLGFWHQLVEAILVQWDLMFSQDRHRFYVIPWFPQKGDLLSLATQLP